MTDLEKALTDIRAVRSQLARGLEFRGYGPAAFAATAALAAIAGLVQGLWLDDPTARPVAYLGLWGGTAALSILLIAAEVVTRARRIHGGLADEMVQAAAEQLLPAVFNLVGIWYLGCGLACLAFAQGPLALSPWAMAVPFGVGQLLAAGLILWTRGRDGRA